MYTGISISGAIRKEEASLCREGGTIMNRSVPPACERKSPSNSLPIFTIAITDTANHDYVSVGPSQFRTR
jgi:hypothetical protein